MLLYHIRPWTCFLGIGLVCFGSDYSRASYLILRFVDSIPARCGWHDAISSTSLVSLYSVPSDVRVRGHFHMKEELWDSSLEAEPNVAGSVPKYLRKLYAIVSKRNRPACRNIGLQISQGLRAFQHVN